MEVYKALPTDLQAIIRSYYYQLVLSDIHEELDRTHEYCEVTLNTIHVANQLGVTFTPFYFDGKKIGVHRYSIGKGVTLYTAYSNDLRFLDIRRELRMRRNKYELRCSTVVHGTWFLSSLVSMKYKTNGELIDQLVESGVRYSLKKKSKRELIQIAMKVE